MLGPMFCCHACGNEVELIDKVKRADTCEHCGADLHCCKNCRFWDPYVHNQCKESVTFYEPDKEKGNFCTYFTIREGTVEREDKSEHMNKLEALFKKK
ncbi:MAG: hypothetical protein HYZ27_02730 [Deltaproteobacteria bacterium]|nr:hypothetical protein [Deltaproteobacteria bacterium]